MLSFGIKLTHLKFISQGPMALFQWRLRARQILLDILYLIGKILRLCSAKTFEVLERHVA